MSLAKFIEQENRVIRIFSLGEKEYDAKNLSEADKQRLGTRVASALSPEALTCDGELRGAKLQAKAKMLRAAKADLEALGVTNEWW
jgi:hypothetical protein